MNFFEIVLTLAISLGAVVWGVNIYNQKGTWFLAGWNTMSKEEKATYNEKAICHLFGRHCQPDCVNVRIKFTNPSHVPKANQAYRE